MTGLIAVRRAEPEAAYRTGGKICIDEALACIADTIAPSPPGWTAIDATCLGWASAEPVRAATDAPLFDCSAMDGYAVRSADTFGGAASPAALRLAADVPAEAVPGALPIGEAAPISTGAPVPVGADAIVVRERTRRDAARLYVDAPVPIGANIRRRGEDMAQGAVVLPAGSILTPDTIGALLCCGVSGILGRRPPSLRIVPTGSELEAAQPRLDANGPMIAAACRGLGIEADLGDPVPDDEPAIRASLFGGRRTDMLLSIGGVSSGRHDLVRGLVEGAGATILFHGLAMRPGKPLLFALLPDGTPFFGLPGNPVAALVAFRFFVMSAIRRFMGLAPETGVRIAPPQDGRDGTTLFLRANAGPPGMGVRLLENQRSHVMHSVLAADSWVRLDGSGPKATAFLYPKWPVLG
jgi:molybdopterin molybdotransferase